VIGVKKQAAIGQDDLFGAIDDGGGAPGIGLDFQLDEREWPRKHLLSTEREMLGLYVSSHPLDGTEHILSRNRDCSIAELLGSGRTEGFVKLCGLVTSVDRRINKAGNAWAIVTIADRDASMEVLYFPKSYLLVAHELIEDNVISVRGRLNERDGAISVFGEEMAPVDISSAEHGGKPPIQLNIPERKINPKLVAELKRTMRAHPGDVPVRLLMEGHSRNVLFELGFLVDPESGFASDIKGLLGPSVWATAV
jgi:DNA polymerase-3 subunit alpha